MKLQVVDNLTNEIIEYDMTLTEVPMGKKWIVGLMILTTLWAMTGCGKQEMIRCEYTNETAGFTLSIDRPVEWTAKLQEGWPATETEEASPDEGILEFIQMTSRRAVSIFVTVFLRIMQGMKMIWRPWK